MLLAAHQLARRPGERASGARWRNRFERCLRVSRTARSSGAGIRGVAGAEPVKQRVIARPKLCSFATMGLRGPSGLATATERPARGVDAELDAALDVVVCMTACETHGPVVRALSLT